jgi:exo-beta-1,3-glucanase (GH17 family)
VTSTILTTTYVCPSAGTYTIAPLTTTCSESTVWVYPTAASFSAGTYTRPATVTTITEVNYVYICPFTTSAAPVPATTAAPVVSAVSHPIAAVSTPVNIVSAIESVASAVIAPVVSVVSSAVSEASSVVSTIVGELGNSGEQYGMTYTPYNSQNGDCLSASQVMTDITAIAKAGFQVVRLYSTDCSALTNIGAACKANNIKMIIGVYISGSGVAGAAAQVSAITSWAQWDLVELCVIGNEAILSGFCTASELAGFITSSKAAIKGAGYTGPFTTAEPLSSWESHASELCPVVDLVGAQLHPFFNSETTADQAGPFVKSQLSIASSLCSGKYALCMESGWPSGGTANGLAVPGVAQQAAAVASVKKHVGGHVIMFSYQNDLWKSAGEFDCEQTWGAFHLYV